MMYRPGTGRRTRREAELGWPRACLHVCPALRRGPHSDGGATCRWRESHVQGAGSHGRRVAVDTSESASNLAQIFLDHSLADTVAVRGSVACHVLVNLKGMLRLKCALPFMHRR